MPTNDTQPTPPSESHFDVGVPGFLNNILQSFTGISFRSRAERQQEGFGKLTKMNLDPSNAAMVDQMVSDPKIMKGLGFEKGDIESVKAMLKTQRLALGGAQFVDQLMAQNPKLANDPNALIAAAAKGGPSAVSAATDLQKSLGPMAQERVKSGTDIAKTGMEVAGREQVGKERNTALTKINASHDAASIERAHIMAQAMEKRASITAGAKGDKTAQNFTKWAAQNTKATLGVFSKHSDAVINTTNAALSAGNITTEDATDAAAKVDLDLAPVIAFDPDVIRGTKPLQQGVMDTIDANAAKILYQEPTTGRLITAEKFAKGMSKLAPEQRQQFVTFLKGLRDQLTTAAGEQLNANREYYQSNFPVFKEGDDTTTGAAVAGGLAPSDDTQDSGGD